MARQTSVSTCRTSDWSRRREEIGDGAHEFHRLDRLVEMRAPKGGDGAQSLRGDVSSQNNSGNRPLKFFPKLGRRPSTPFGPFGRLKSATIMSGISVEAIAATPSARQSDDDRHPQKHFEKFADGRIILDDENRGAPFRAFDGGACSGIARGSVSRGFHRHVDAEHGTMPGREIRSIGWPSRVDNRCTDRKTKAQSPAALRAGLLICETPRDRETIFLGIPGPVSQTSIRHRLAAPAAPEQHLAARREFRGVREQVAENLLQ